MLKHIRSVLSVLSLTLVVSNASAFLGFGRGCDNDSKKSTTTFVPVFNDHNKGLVWGRALTQPYSNGYADIVGKNNDGEYKFQCQYESSSLTGQQQLKSDAEDACEKIGARLPTEDDYVSLVSNFDHSAGGLTEDGLQEMNEAFEDMGCLGGFWVKQNVCETVGNAWHYYFPGATVYNAAMSLMKSEFLDAHQQIRCVRDMTSNGAK